MARPEDNKSATVISSNGIPVATLSDMERMELEIKRLDYEERVRREQARLDEIKRYDEIREQMRRATDAAEAKKRQDQANCRHRHTENQKSMLRGQADGRGILVLSCLICQKEFRSDDQPGTGNPHGGIPVDLMPPGEYIGGPVIVQHQRYSPPSTNN